MSLCHRFCLDTAFPCLYSKKNLCFWKCISRSHKLSGCIHPHGCRG